MPESVPIPIYADPQRALSKRNPDAHAGLWYERFFNRYEKDSESGFHVPDAGKKDWIKTVTGKIGDDDDLMAHASCVSNLVAQLEGCKGIFASDWHFVTGLGNAHPVENGFTWHPTLGVPYLPGSAVKGLLRSYMEVWCDAAQRRLITPWFGGTEKQSPADSAGGLIFFDALPVTRPMLTADVMTPHMGKWYAEGADRPGEADTTPADWHDPQPIPFLVAKELQLLFAIAPRSMADQDASRDAMALLKDALSTIGAGAKTAVGYGVMRRDEAAEKGFEHGLVEKRREQNKAQEVAREERVRAERLANASPAERKKEEILSELQQGATKTAQYKALIKALENDKWEDAEKKEIAESVKKDMQEDNTWRPVSQKRRPEKDREHQMTLALQNILNNLPDA